MTLRVRATRFASPLTAVSVIAGNPLYALADASYRRYAREHYVSHIPFKRLSGEVQRRWISHAAALNEPS